MQQRRPPAIVFASVLWFLQIVLGTLYTLDRGLSFASIGLLILTGAILIFGLISVGAIWAMKKWGLVAPSLALVFSIFGFIATLNVTLIPVSLLILAVLLPATLSMRVPVDMQGSVPNKSDRNNSSSANRE